MERVEIAVDDAAGNHQVAFGCEYGHGTAYLGRGVGVEQGEG